MKDNEKVKYLQEEIKRKEDIIIQLQSQAADTSDFREFVLENLKIIMISIGLNLRKKHNCIPCEGSGRIYASPITDAGQDNFGKCLICYGRGYIWL